VTSPAAHPPVTSGSRRAEAEQGSGAGPPGRLAQPRAAVVVSGAVTRAQLDENLTALTVGQLPALSLAEADGAYWAQRAARPWH